MNVAVSVNRATGNKFKPNRNGVMPLILNALNGALPVNSGIIDGSIASGLGIEPNRQYVLSIQFRGYYKQEEYGTKYPNYNYVVVTSLGAGFEQLVSEQVVASMNFGFTPQSAPTPTSVVETPTPIQEEEPAFPIEESEA